MSDDEVWEDLSGLPVDPPPKREICCRCGRPSIVCWCLAIPNEPFRPRGRIVLLQHPAEERRCLRTAPMLQLSLCPDRCLIFKGKKFPRRHEGLSELLNHPDTLLLYPSKKAVNLASIAHLYGATYTLVIIDGTWPQAKAMYNNSPVLLNMKQAKLEVSGVSEYVIRTQPMDGCISTLETAARALALMENDPAIQEKLLLPLHTLCDYQLAHGAVTHHSKEYKTTRPQT